MDIANGNLSPKQVYASAPRRFGVGDSPEAGWLHVIFHGMMWFFPTQNGFLIRIPRIQHSMDSMANMAPMPANGGEKTTADSGGPAMPMPMHQNGMYAGGETMSAVRNEHVCVAGHWLGELSLQPGTYELKGVFAGGARYLSPKYNLVLPQAGPAPQVQLGNAWLADILAPFPEKITSLLRTPLDPIGDYFSGNVPGGCQYLSGIQIFTYRFANQFKLALGDHPWRAGGMVDEKGYCVLHIYSEPDRRTFKGMPAGTHTGLAFRQGLKMTQGADLQLMRPLRPFAPILRADIPHGVLYEELEDYSLRLKRMQVLGAMRRDQLNLNEIWDFDPFVHTSDPERCGGMSGTAVAPVHPRL